MPKIPTYDIKGRVTADVPSTGTIPSIDVRENILEQLNQLLILL